MSPRFFSIVSFLIAAAVLIGFLLFVSPNDLPLYALFIPFIAIFIMSFIAVRALARSFLQNISQQAQHWFALFVSALPVVLLILRSSGQMDSSDGWLFVALGVLLFFYLRKTDFLK